MGCNVLGKRVGLIGQKLGSVRCWSSAGVHRLAKENAETKHNVGRTELGPGFLPKHVIMVIKHQKDPLKALEVFNSVAREEGFKHTFFTYKALIEKLGYHGEFESMEKVLAEMRMNISGGSFEGIYISIMRNYGRLGQVQEAVDTFERMEFYDCEPTVGSYNTIMNILVENTFFLSRPTRSIFGCEIRGLILMFIRLLLGSSPSVELTELKLHSGFSTICPNKVARQMLLLTVL